LTTIFLMAQAESQPATGWQGIVEGDGISIAITGMLIVFAALTIISLFIALVPHLLAALAPILPKLHSHHAPPGRAEQVPLEHEKVVAAIAAVLHTELQIVMRKP
jgi:Na+-transporting methylmalonyl-CoA/oxaloacetate decarboxylase gamma subunit